MSRTNEQKKLNEMDSPGRVNKDEIKQSQVSVMLQDFKQDKGTFNFLNGDKYEGEYLATKAPLSIVREGLGTHWTNDGSIYKGVWVQDYLEKADPITFPDESELSGTLDNMIAEGHGTYKFKEGVEIQGFLINNQFVGDVKLKDPRGHYWKSLNSKETTELFFTPAQIFLHSITNTNNHLLTYETDGAP